MAIKITIKGKVHDVGYRLFLLEEADSLFIPCFDARNVKIDGKEVLIVLVDGEKEQVEQFVEFVKKNKPEIAIVEEISVEEFRGRVKDIEKFRTSFNTIQLSKIVQIGINMLGKQDKMLEKQDLMLSKMDLMLEKQDKMLEKQDLMLSKMDLMLEKQDKMLEKQDLMLSKMDLMLEKQDESIKEIKETKIELKGGIVEVKEGVKEVSSKLDKTNDLLEKRFEKLEQEIERIKKALIKAGIEF